MHIMHPRAESAAPSSLALPTIHQPPPNLTCCRRTANLAGLHPPRSKSREPLQNAVSPLQCALHSLQAELDRRGLAHTVIMEDGHVHEAQCFAPNLTPHLNCSPNP